MDKEEKKKWWRRLFTLVIILILCVLVVAACIFLFKSANSGLDWLLKDENIYWIFFGGVPLIGVLMWLSNN
jgi:uncharacterized BrkB/YihY/UPF0761 family membrane protein